MIDFFAFSPVRGESSRNLEETCQSPQAQVLEPEEMTPEKIMQVPSSISRGSYIKRGRDQMGYVKRPLKEKLRRWELDKHFEVTAEGHLGCKKCMAHRRHHGESKEKKKKKKETTCPAKEKTCPVEEEKGSPLEGSSSEEVQCIAASLLSKGTFVAGKVRNLRWRLVKHISGTHHRKSQMMCQEEEEDDVPDDVPTDAQMYFTYDIVKTDPVGGGAPQYEKRCREARAHGDLSNVPAFRWSAPVFRQNLLSLEDAVKMHVYEKLLSKKNPVKFMCWSEDACKQFEQMMVRVVFKDRSVKDTLVKWHWHQGKSTSHEKAEAIAEAVSSFCQDDPATLTVFKKHCKAFLADGAFAEPLAAVLVKVRDVLPFLYAGRCLMHAKQRNLENAVQGDTELAELLDLLVIGKASKNTKESAVWMGGLCRALKNRDRHRSKFSANVEEELQKVQESLEELGETWTGPRKMPTGKHSVSAAPQRFDSLLTGLRTIVLNFRAVLCFLVSLQGPWAMRLLKKLQNTEAQVQLAALCELLEMVSVYVHRDEGHDASKSSLLTATSDWLTLCKDLCYMFGGHEEEGEEAKPPRCTSSEYSKGYYQILKKGLASLGEDFVYRSERGATLFGWRRPSPEEEATVIAKALKKMQHVTEVFKEACKADLEMALAWGCPTYY